MTPREPALRQAFNPRLPGSTPGRGAMIPPDT
jgi:hypothetical protein